MFQIGKSIKFKKVVSGFSLVEILISLAIFSILIATVITTTMSMINSQKKVQAKLFLSQTAGTTLESMSRQIRYGYSYTGNTQSSYSTSEAGQTIYIKTTTLASGVSATSTTNLVNAVDSPFILFEAQTGNPNSWTDQNAFCFANGQLYKITKFDVETDGTTYKARCDTGAPMLPDNISLEKISFDIYAGNIQNPKNPMVRIKLRLKHEDAGSTDVQTTITQRLVTYF